MAVGAVAVALAAIVPYLGALGNGFVWDDLHLIVRDSELDSARGVWLRLGQDFFAAARDPSMAGYWRPLVTLSFAADRSIWGLSPRGFHLTNVLLHAVCAVLAVVLLRAITANAWVAVSAGLLFALHPMHVESVAFVAGRTDMIAALLACLAVLAHLRGTRLVEAAAPQGRSRGRWLQAAAVGLFLLGLLAKEMAVVAVAWLAALHLASDRRGWRRSAALMAPFVATTVAYLALRLLVVRVSLPEPRVVPLGDVLRTAPATLARYLEWLLVPVGLQGFVQNPTVTSLVSPRLLVGLLVVAAASWGLVGAWRHSRPAFALGAMSLAAIAPLLHILPIKGPHDMGLVMAERFLYLPSVPFLGLVSLLVAGAISRLPTRARAAVATAVLLGVSGWWTATVVARVPDWRDDIRFFSTAVRDVPGSPTMVANLANAYAERGDMAAAASVLDGAPASVREEQPFRLAKAQVLASQGRFQEALVEMESVTVTRWPGDGRARNNLACLYRLTGRLPESVAVLDELVREGNDLPETYVNLVEAFRARGDLRQAIAACNRGRARFPDDSPLAVLCSSHWPTSPLPP
ncbi:MAG: tetratricopeptide repeat protein [Thermoanaerobaculaceae bacterium]